MISINSLTFGYGDTKVLDNLSINFKKKLNVVIGPNAAGKSTLLKCIFGILNPKGDVFWQGNNISKMSKEEKMALMVYLPQQDMGDTMLTVFETILLGRISSLSWIVKDEDLERVYLTLKCLGIEDLAKKYVSELSGGQKKLVAIAQTLVRNPRMILMDEPTNSLDMKKQLELFEIITQIIEYRDIEFLIVLHDLNLACRYAEQLTILDSNGRQYASGNPKDIVTEQMIEKVYGVNARVMQNDKGVPVISPISSIDKINVFN